MTKLNKVEAFQTADGTLYLDEGKAFLHEKGLEFEALVSKIIGDCFWETETPGGDDLCKAMMKHRAELIEKLQGLEQLPC